MDVRGKIAFISGGAGGIGQGMARTLLDSGAKVVIADLALDRAKSVADELSALGSVIAVHLDVTSAESWEAARVETEARIGPCDILCSNAGVSFTGPLDEIAVEAWRWVYEVNIFGSLYATRTFLPGMKARGQSGHVLLTSSITALHPFAGQGAYTSSKAALLNFATVLKLELEGTLIGVSAMCPGIVATQLRANAIQARPDGLREQPVVNGSLSTAMGMAPEFVGRAAVEAILEDRFFVFPHIDYRDSVASDRDLMLAAMTSQADPGYREPAQFIQPLLR